MTLSIHNSATGGNHFCWKDIAADVAGIALGTAVHAGLLWMFG